MALCSRCTYPSIHFFVSRSRSVVWCVHVACVARVVCCVLYVCVHVVLCVVVCVCVWCCVWWCVCVCCGGACVWCVVKLGTRSLSLALSLSFLLSLLLSLSIFPSPSLSLSFSLFFFFFSLLFLFPLLLLLLLLFVLSLFLLSSLLATKHYGKNRSAVVRLKTKRDLFITGLFPARNLIFITVLNKFQKLAAGENYRRHSFILIPKQLVCNASNL